MKGNEKMINAEYSELEFELWGTSNNQYRRGISIKQIEKST